jgi:hypothetical protein
MNKKLIRLTEQDLHRIVKESVQRILAEAHPLSWATVAAKYGDPNSPNYDPEKAAYAMSRGGKAWTNKYGTKDGKYQELDNGNQRLTKMGIRINQNIPNYMVTDNIRGNGSYDDLLLGLYDGGMITTGGKFDNTTKERGSNLGARDGGYYAGQYAYDDDPKYVERAEELKQRLGREPFNVARQMAKGTGAYEYNKEKGWHIPD